MAWRSAAGRSGQDHAADDGRAPSPDRSGTPGGRAPRARGSRASGIAARARCVASCTAGALSEPASISVGAAMASNWPGRYTQPSSTRHSLGTVGPAARQDGHRGPARRSLTSSAGSSRMLGQHRHDRGVDVAGGHGLLDRVDRTGGIRQAQARLVQHEVVDVVRAGGAAHRAVGAVGVAPQRDRSASARGDGVDDRGDVLELPLDGVGAASPLAPKPRRSMAWTVTASRDAHQPTSRRWSGRRSSRGPSRAAARRRRPRPRAASRPVDVTSIASPRPPRASACSWRPPRPRPSWQYDGADRGRTSGVRPMRRRAQGASRPCSIANSVAPARVVTPALA